VALALLQTRHEWCRLVNIVGVNHGEEAKKKLFDTWVADDEAAKRTQCPPPPPPQEETSNYYESYNCLWTNEGEVPVILFDVGIIIAPGNSYCFSQGFTETCTGEGVCTVRPNGFEPFTYNRIS
jgi:hypothetical protein